MNGYYSKMYTVNPEYITVLKANDLQEMHGITFFIITFFYISGGAKIQSLLQLAYILFKVIIDNVSAILFQLTFT